MLASIHLVSLSRTGIPTSFELNLYQMGIHNRRTSAAMTGQCRVNVYGDIPQIIAVH
jgi:hypothetical protein